MKMAKINQRWVTSDLSHYFAIWRSEYKIDLQQKRILTSVVKR